MLKIEVSQAITLRYFLYKSLYVSGLSCTPVAYLLFTWSTFFVNLWLSFHKFKSIWLSHDIKKNKSKSLLFPCPVVTLPSISILEMSISPKNINIVRHLYQEITAPVAWPVHWLKLIFITVIFRIILSAAIMYLSSFFIIETLMARKWTNHPMVKFLYLEQN